MGPEQVACQEGEEGGRRLRREEDDDRGMVAHST
jgi:hypothetical protein